MKFNVSPLTCGRCVGVITDALHAMDPAATVHVDLDAGTVDTEGAFDAGAVASTLADHGYTAVPASSQAPAGTCCGSCHV